MAEDFIEREPDKNLSGPEQAREMLRIAKENAERGDLPPRGTQGELLPREAGRSPEARRLIDEARAKLNEINERKAS